MILTATMLIVITIYDSSLKREKIVLLYKL